MNNGQTDGPPTGIAAEAEAVVDKVEALEKAVEEPLTEAAVAAAGSEPPAKKRELRRMGGLRALDAAAFLAVNHLPHSQASNDVIELMSDLGKGAGWIGLAAFALWQDGKSGRRAGLTAVAAMLTATGIAQGPIKARFARRRPFHDVVGDIVIGKRGTDHSFPSGHSAGSFAAATALAATYPQHVAPLFGAAAGVAFSRIYLGHHYPSDVLAGSAIGIAIGTAYAATLKVKFF